MTEFTEGSGYRGIAHTPEPQPKAPCKVTDITSRLVYGGYRVSFNLWIHGCMSSISGKFVSVKDCQQEHKLASYLEGIL